ncbi:hypothetical protein [Streptomyces sp. NPDC086787]|uniref:hypothetical protein n=1 Tax=Streptomyces sp. NPDC086787 TaxID=3365759 RepID=UPI003822BBE0
MDHQRENHREEQRAGPRGAKPQALFALAVAAVAVTHLALGMDAVWSFWIAYILTRPLGASVGDHLSQPSGHGWTASAHAGARPRARG